MPFSRRYLLIKSLKCKISSQYDYRSRAIISEYILNQPILVHNDCAIFGIYKYFKHKLYSQVIRWGPFTCRHYLLDY